MGQALTYDSPVVPVIRRRVPLTAKWIRYLPIVVVVSYLTLTVLVYALGPWAYPELDATSMYVFLGCAHGALAFGYTRTASRPAAGYRGKLNVRVLVLVSALTSLALVFPTAAFRTGSYLPDVVSGIQNPGQAYNATQVLRRDATGVVEYVRIGLSPLLAMLLPLTVGFWSRLTRPIRILAVVPIAGALSLTVAMGTNKVVADTLLIVTVLLAANYFGGRLFIRRFRTVALAAVIVVGAILFASFFSQGMRSRSGSAALYGYMPAVGARADLRHPMIAFLGPEAQVGVLGLCGYLSNGYYGLLVSMQQPYVPTFGFGHSMFLTRQAARILDDDSVLHRTYPDRVEATTGWDAYVNWATIYPWLASDFTFPGTLVIIFLIGRLFAQAWAEAVDGKNPFAFCMLAQFTIMLFYFCANNQCLQDGEGLTAFWTIFALWRLTRNRKARKALSVTFNLQARAGQFT